MNNLNLLNGGRRRFGLALAAIALVAAIVTLGGGLSAPRSADAQANPSPGIGSSHTEVAQGFTFTVTYQHNALNNGGGDWVNVRILPSSTAKGVFFGTTSQVLACQDGASGVTSPCDRDDRPEYLAVAVTTAQDSPNGPLVIQVGKVGDASTNLTVVVNVSDSLVVRGLSMTSNKQGIAINSGLGATTATISLKALNSRGTSIAQASVRLSTTLGTLSCPQRIGNPRTGVQSCIVETLPASLATGLPITLTSTAKAGTATITATAFGYTGIAATVSVVIYGPPAKITLAPDQETIAQRGVTFIVVTVTDAGGNAVVGNNPTAPASAVKGPSANAVNVHVGNNIPRSAPPPTIPECGKTTAPRGTNAKGQCVLRVSGQATAAPTTTPIPTAAPGGGGTATPTATATATATSTPVATPTRGFRGSQLGSGGVFAAQTAVKPATRGAHMITVTAGGAATVKATTTIYVGGPPKAIATDAPARVKALSETRITATITDDTNIRVGAVPVSVDQIEGDGKITLGATTNASMSSDGRYSFSFLAPRSGRVAFLVSAGAAAARISETIVIQVGDAPPAKTWSGTPTSGWNNLTWDGADGASVAGNIGPNVSAVYRWNVAAQRWDAYFPSASGVPGGNDFTTLMQGATYWVFSR